METKENGRYKQDSINYHGLGKAGFTQAIKSIGNPQSVMLSSKSNSKIELAIEGLDNKGRGLLSIVTINTSSQNSREFIEAHIVNSIYGKRNIERYISKSNSEGRLIYNKNNDETPQGIPPVRYQGDINAESSFINSIFNSPDNVKSSVKKSDIVACLVDTYNYTEQTANKIFANAYNLKKKTGSKADMQEVSAVIANALEKRRSGNFGESDVSAVADLIASGAMTENETVTAEAKPILDYLTGNLCNNRKRFGKTAQRQFRRI
ncbi:MAG: hypothetical protein IJE14_04300 [Clostridia bacterium]|nr:hypothetical protein [Clostridia bacterium]